MDIHLDSGDPTVQASVDDWKRSHRRVVILMGILYFLSLAVSVYGVWSGKVRDVLACLPVIFLPAGIPFFGYLTVYLRGIRILALGRLVPARRVNGSSWLLTSAYAYDVDGKTFSSLRYLIERSHAKRLAVPVAFVDPSNSRRAIIILVGGERR